MWKSVTTFLRSFELPFESSAHPEEAAKRPSRRTRPPLSYPFVPPYETAEYPVEVAKHERRNSKRLGVILLSLLFSSLAHAKASDWSELKYSGYIDTSYNYLRRSNHFTSGVHDRLNDINENGFTLQQAAMTFAYQPVDGFGGLLNVIVGRDAYSLAPLGWNPYYGSQMLGLVMPEAYAQFASNRLTVIAGMFDSEMGYESYEPTHDTNFSRSILDGYAEPGVTMGVRAIYRHTDWFTINAGMNNGWAGIRDTSRHATYELGGTYFFNRTFNLTLQTLSGEERLVTLFTSGPTGRRNMVELIASLQATDKLELVSSVDYGVQRKAILADRTIGQAVWKGINAYINCQWTDKWFSSVRGEVYADTDGYTTGVSQNWREITLTVDYRPAKSWLLRAETRHDVSNISSFVNRGAPGANNNQQSFGAEAIYQF